MYCFWAFCFVFLLFALLLFFFIVSHCHDVHLFSLLLVTCHVGQDLWDSEHVLMSCIATSSFILPAVYPNSTLCAPTYPALKQNVWYCESFENGSLRNNMLLQRVVLIKKALGGTAVTKRRKRYHYQHQKQCGLLIHQGNTNRPTRSQKKVKNNNLKVEEYLNASHHKNEISQAYTWNLSDNANSKEF